MKLFRFINWWFKSGDGEEIGIIFLVAIPCLLAIISGILVFFTNSLWAVSLLPIYTVVGLVIIAVMYICDSVREYKKVLEEEAEIIIQKLRTGR